MPAPLTNIAHPSIRPTRAARYPSTQRASTRWLRRLLITCVFFLVGLILFLPLCVVFYEGARQGLASFWETISDPNTIHAIYLTLLTLVVSVPLNVVFGIAAAWCIAKFDFPFKSALITLIDLPFAISPVVAGLMIILIFGARGWFGFWFVRNFPVIFAVPGVIIATTFITVPFVARELIPLMQSQGTEEEEAARSLGAGALQTFWRVTLPNIRWGLLYGIILCAARAMGEFGAVAVVSGSIIGQTETMPLRVYSLYNGAGHSYEKSFAVASLLAASGLVNLILKTWVEGRIKRS